MRPWCVPLALTLALAGRLPAGGPDPAAWKAGVAVRVITPAEPMWMAGYARLACPHFMYQAL